MRQLSTGNLPTFSWQQHRKTSSNYSEGNSQKRTWKTWPVTNGIKPDAIPQQNSPISSKTWKEGRSSLRQRSRHRQQNVLVSRTAGRHSTRTHRGKQRGDFQWRDQNVPHEEEPISTADNTIDKISSFQRGHLHRHNHQNDTPNLITPT